MVDELVLGLEWFILASASRPGASGFVVGGAIDVVECEMIDEIGHFRKRVAADLTVVHPLALMVSSASRLDVTVVGFRKPQIDS